MRESFHRQFLVLLVLILPILTYSQWEMAEGLDGGKITAIASVESGLFVACEDNGIYHNINGTWEQAYYNKDYTKLTACGNCVFIYGAFISGACKRSFDYGENWESVPNLSNVSEILSIDSVIFFAFNGIWARSNDFGDTYDTIQIPVMEAFAELLADDSLLYLHRYDLEELNKLYFSVDYGQQWDSISTDGLFPSPYAIPKQIKYLNGSFWAVTQSINSGPSAYLVYLFNEISEEWTNVTSNLPFLQGFRDLVNYNGNIVCAYYSYPVFKFNYADSSWTEFTDGSKSVNQFVNHNDILYCATNQGPCILDTAGNWTTDYSGLLHRNISSIDTREEKIYVTANGELFESDNWGNNFTRNDNVYGQQIITTDTVFYMLSIHDFQLTWDGGVTWQSFTEGIEDHPFLRFHHFSITPKYYYLGTSQGLYRSSSSLVYWTKLENGPFNNPFSVDNIEAIDNTIMVGQNWPPHELYFSRNYGYSFDLFGNYCNFCKIDLDYYLLKDSILYSKDEGNSWIHIPHNYNYYKYCIDKKADTLILGGRTTGNDPTLQRSSNMGGYWIDIVDNLPSNYYASNGGIQKVKIMGSRLFAACPGSGLWYRDDLFVGVPEKGDLELSNILEIYVYPNPVTENIYVDFSQIREHEIRMSVYNSEGILIQELQLKSINKIECIKLSTLKPGVYFLNFTTNGRSLVKKIVKL